MGCRVYCSSFVVQDVWVQDVRVEVQDVRVEGWDLDDRP